MAEANIFLFVNGRGQTTENDDAEIQKKTKVLKVSGRKYNKRFTCTAS